ncbi:MAG TPA: recombinase family protein [Pseudobacteroides sp.]|uniref:recombinase family protein n=1 Tax=Pseudobacteroides sp. TaxID=1968840 RepID=UPI002F927749
MKMYGYVRTFILPQATYYQMKLAKENNEKILNEKVIALLAIVPKQNIFVDKNIRKYVQLPINADLPGYASLLQVLNKGDVVVAMDIKSMASSVQELLEFISFLRSQGIFFKSISEPYIDTSTIRGDFVFEFIKLLAELEKQTTSFCNGRYAKYNDTCYYRVIDTFDMFMNKVIQLFGSQGLFQKDVTPVACKHSDSINYGGTNACKWYAYSQYAFHELLTDAGIINSTKK